MTAPETAARRWRRMAVRGVIGIALVLAVLIYNPWVLAFPYRTQIGEITVYSVEKPSPALTAEIARASARIAASEIAAPLGSRAIYLTDGGWRWWLLSLPVSRGAFAITRPFSSSIVVNRSAIDGDGVWNGAAVGGYRTLAGTIAHESTHLLIYHRYGPMAAWRFASWKVEGYCDHVAQESSLTAGDAARLTREGAAPPALAYFEGRQRVETRLAQGASVDALMTGD
jgi:hypothetical protein